MNLIGGHVTVYWSHSGSLFFRRRQSRPAVIFPQEQGFFFFGFETFCRLQVAPEWPGLIEGKLRLQAFSFSEQVSVQGFCMYYKLSSLLVRVDLRLAL